MFEFNKDYIINIVKNNRTIISWPLLYNKLGISGILTYLGKYDIHNIFMNNDLIQEIQNIMISNMKSLKKSEFPKEYKSYSILKMEYKLKSLEFELMNYAPTIKDDIDGLAFKISYIN